MEHPRPAQHDEPQRHSGPEYLDKARVAVKRQGLVLLAMRSKKEAHLMNEKDALTAMISAVS